MPDVMPIALQIVTIQRNLEKLNPGLGDPLLVWSSSHQHMVEWAEYLDPELSLPENIELLEHDLPDVQWRVKKETSPWKAVQRKHESWYAGRNSDSYLLRAIAIVQPHKVKAKNKTYTRGRIQLTLDKGFIGHKAKVSVFIQGACPHDPSNPTKLLKAGSRRKHDRKEYRERT